MTQEAWEVDLSRKDSTGPENELLSNTTPEGNNHLYYQSNIIFFAKPQEVLIALNIEHESI